MKIVLLGYMASGKSAVGKVLSDKMNMQFVDLDCYIEQKEAQSISDIFNIKGEIYFRKKESECLLELLNSKMDQIISLGGGTPCYGNNMDHIVNKSVSFYLQATAHTVFERLKHETLQRPLVATLGIEKLYEYIAKHLFERAPFYERAQHIIPVNYKDIEEVGENIYRLINLYELLC